ncbi:MAG: zinc-ribbon family [Oscillospiraceae bacterium]|nr:zinc-ribbon family [Oscillospiraceae bacterium]
MLKMVYFSIFDVRIAKDQNNKTIKHMFIPAYEPVTNFVDLIGKENVVSYSFFGDSGVPSIALVYDDDELLTCPECGKEISNGFNFCPNCAAKLK